ncbi:MAG: hypothetical protein Q8P46_14485 [Hyphomicrobiales bacterium]|nr:hypothetical protein [Hyphomicrobiales bacterium]
MMAKRNVFDTWKRTAIIAALATFVVALALAGSLTSSNNSARPAATAAAKSARFDVREAGAPAVIVIDLDNIEHVAAPPPLSAPEEKEKRE